jgi:copper chaperone
MEKVILNVKGMFGDCCVKSIETKVGKLNGIDSVSVHLDNGKVDVTFDFKEVDLKDITDVIEDQKYRVKGWELSIPVHS